MLRSGRTTLLGVASAVLSIGLVVSACTQSGASPAPSPTPSDVMMEHSASPDVMMEHSASPDVMMEHSPSPSP